MLFVTIGTLSTGLGVKNASESSLKNQTPFDASVQVFDKNNSNRISVLDALNQLNYNVDDNADYVVIRQYKSNISSRDVLAKYALSSDQKWDVKF